jgi:hypothetical protein
MLSKLKSIIISAAVIFAGAGMASAEELNLPGFTGNINTTVSTGIQIRVDDNCLGLTGANDIHGDSVFYAAVNTNRSADASVLLSDYEPGCAKIWQDGYGNPVDPKGSRRELISNNADDGRMNFRKYDVFNQTTKVFTEIDGTLDGGVGLTASLIGSYNAIDSINSPSWAPFTNSALDDIESNLDILDLYITTDIAELDATLNIGRYVTNWGESTFIPVGMNGLTTNAIDLNKLRTPGASIREALVPANQITLSGYLDGGVSYEAYMQLGESHVEFDPNGTFFGNEVISGDRLLFTSAFGQNSQTQASACSYLIAVGGGLGCTQAAVDYSKTTAGKQATQMYYFQEGIKALAGAGTANNTKIILKSAGLGGGAPAAAAIGGNSGDMYTLAGAGYASSVAAGYAAWSEFDNKQARKAGALDAFGGNHVYADGDEQYGIALRTYLDGVGSGVDLGFYYTQYDSKVPYLRFIGQQGIHAGDLLGLLTFAATCGAEGATCDDGGVFAAGSYFSDAAGEGAITSLSTAENVGLGRVAGAIVDLAYSEAGCGAYMNPKAVDTLYNSGAAGAAASNFSYTSAQKANALTYYNYTVIGGKLYHDSAKCAQNAKTSGSTTGNNFGTAATQLAAGGILGAAVTPLNVTEYDFIYPENLQAMGISANTNIGGTTVQAEVTYRPNFPLATNGGDQGQQISDAAGTTALLSIAVAQGVRGACAAVGGSATHSAVLAQIDGDPTTYAKCATQVAAVNAYRASNQTGVTSRAEWEDVVGALKNFKRSSLPAISLATVAGGDYYSTPFIKKDVWSGTLGTTTSFSASHPVTETMGADSAFLLTEIGFVYVPDLDYAEGGINRGGYRDGVGGEKCGGVTRGGGNPTTYNSARVLDGATHIGAGQTDPLFGNGSYCESKNTIDETSLTYRLVGGAAYNNVMNSAWTFNPSVVWSHDFSGYGPTSMGGFTPGRMSLSISGNVSKGDVSMGLSYVNELGDEQDNLNFDKDYISANVSYAF